MLRDHNYSIVTIESNARLYSNLEITFRQAWTAEQTGEEEFLWTYGS